METTNTLNAELNNAVFLTSEQAKKAEPYKDFRLVRMIKKGDNSKLPYTAFVAIPETRKLPDLAKHPAISQYLLSAYYELEKFACQDRLIAGDKIMYYSDLSTDNLETIAAKLNESNNTGQLSEERIASWFESSARELLIVAISEWLGLSDNITEQDVKKCEQIANQLKGNMQKLASKKPVTFAPHVKNALNKALEVVACDEFACRLHAKLNNAVDEQDMLANLGF